MSEPAPKRTALYDEHVKLGARIVPFAGYEMPVQYPLGVLKEHLWTREKAGLSVGTGPYRVITQLGLYGFDDMTKKLKLLAVFIGIMTVTIIAVGYLFNAIM